MSSMTLEGLSQVVTNYVANNHTTKLAFGCGLICAFAAIESACRVIHNLYQSTDESVRNNPKFSKDVSENLGGVVLFGLCASNAIPCTAAIGAGILLLNAVSDKHPADDALIITEILNKARPLVIGLCKAGGEVLDMAGKALWAIAKAVGHIVKFVFELIWKVMCAVGTILGPIFQIIIPSSPIGYAATALALAVIFYKGVLGK